MKLKFLGTRDRANSEGKPAPPAPQFFRGAIDFRMIEPYSEVLRRLVPESDPYLRKLTVADLQDVPTSFFSDLQANDILFIDSSHVCKPSRLAPREVASSAE